MKRGQNVGFDEISNKFLNVYLYEISGKFENCLVGIKTRSLDQISEKPCVLFRCHIFSVILTKLGQNVCLS